MKLKKHALIEIDCVEGNSVLPIHRLSSLGETTSNFRIVDQELQNGTLKVSLEALKGSSHALRFYLPKGYSATTGIGKMRKVSDYMYEANVLFENSQTPYCKKAIYITVPHS